MKETIYSSEPALRNCGQLFRQMVCDIITCRELAWQLFIRDLKARYRQTIGGFFWIVVPPIVTTLTFAFLNAQKIINFAETPVPYAPYAFVGMLLWGSFQDSVLHPLQSLEKNTAILIKIQFPSEAVLLSSMGTLAFNFLVRMALMLPVFVFFDIDVSATMLLAPLGFLAVIVLGLAISIVLAPLAMLYKDIQKGLSVIMGFWMFLTPVIYPPPKQGAALILAKYNPVSPLLVTARDWAFGFEPQYLQSFYAVALMSAALFALGWLLYRLAKPHVVARLGM